MSETAGGRETLARARHGIRRFFGKTILTFEQRKQFDRENEFDILDGFLHDPEAYRERKTAEEAEANRFVGTRILKSMGKWVVDWWKADEPSIKTNDTNLKISEEDFLEGLAGPTEAQKRDHAAVKAAIEAGPRWDEDLEIRW